MSILLKDIRVIDPQLDLDEICDLLIDDGKIAEIGKGLAAQADEIRDMTGKIAIPGLVDVHVHLRDFGLEYKEDIASGTRAAFEGPA